MNDILIINKLEELGKQDLIKELSPLINWNIDYNVYVDNKKKFLSLSLIALKDETLVNLLGKKVIDINTNLIEIIKNKKFLFLNQLINNCYDNAKLKSISYKLQSFDFYISQLIEESLNKDKINKLILNDKDEINNFFKNVLFFIENLQKKQNENKDKEYSISEINNLNKHYEKLYLKIKENWYLKLYMDNFENVNINNIPEELNVINKKDFYKNLDSSLFQNIMNLPVENFEKIINDFSKNKITIKLNFLNMLINYSNNVLVEYLDKEKLKDGIEKSLRHYKIFEQNLLILYKNPKYKKMIDNLLNENEEVKQIIKNFAKNNFLLINSLFLLNKDKEYNGLNLKEMVIILKDFDYKEKNYNINDFLKEKNKYQFNTNIQDFSMLYGLMKTYQLNTKYEISKIKIMNDILSSNINVNITIDKIKLVNSTYSMNLPEQKMEKQYLMYNLKENEKNISNIDKKIIKI